MPNWTYNGKTIKSFKDAPQDAVGFIYNITNLETGKQYIGRKSFISTTNPTVSKAVYDRDKKAGLKVGKKKNKKKSIAKKIVWDYKRQIIKETDWLKYCGSSKDLKKDIKKGIQIKKEILQYCYTKKQMTYYETKWQMCLGVIEENNDLYYNGNILGKYFPDNLTNNGENKKPD